MLDLLPRLLTKGVTATRDGLEFETGRGWSNWFTGRLRGEVYFVRWNEASERLRYRAGEPWCTDGGTAIMFYGGSSGRLPPEHTLHRLASIMCDDAEAFRVLHWCVSHLAQEDSK